ncbi:MAG: alpha/beta fold hydrolase [Promethearchaeota archaeon]|nr:MAG: alpha/beta fold hydrolase [Candidatus Lokiarchaeota archaeon]
MKKLEYKDYWFNYVLKANPQEIKNLIQEDYIDSQGFKIHLDLYDKVGLSDKTIIFVHGTSVYSRFYAEFCYHLFQNGYRVVAPDLIGHGMSEGKRGHFTMEMFAKTIYDVNTYVREKFGENVAVMGSSLGGITTLYSVAYDERFKAGICHNAAIFNEGAYKKIIKIKGKLKELIEEVPNLAKTAPTSSLSVYNYLDFHKLAKSEEMSRMVDLLMKDKILSDKYSMTALYTQMSAPLAKSPEKITTPIMIINGDEDYLFSIEYMTEIYERLTCKQKKLEILKDTSHLIFQENIQETLERILPWLKLVLS